MSPVSRIHAAVEAYLVARRSMGFDLRIDERQLRAFARFADAVGHRGPITVALAVQWAQQAGSGRRLTWARRLQTLRPLTRYLVPLEPDTELVPNGLFGPTSRRLVPHIYTEPEIAALLQAAAALPSRPTLHLRPRTYLTLFGVLACTGLRISEALALTPTDVDLDRASLIVRQTKFRKSRLVPLHPTTVTALSEYVQARRSGIHDRDIRTFFIADRGTPLGDRTVHHTFATLRTRLGWVGRGDYLRPRIHDLRHSYVCRALVRAYQQHESVDHIVDVLSTYVGHAGVSQTYWYLTAIPELLALAGQRFARQAEGDVR